MTSLQSFEHLSTLSYLISASCPLISGKERPLSLSFLKHYNKEEVAFLPLYYMWWCNARIRMPLLHCCNTLKKDRHLNKTKKQTNDIKDSQRIVNERLNEEENVKLIACFVKGLEYYVKILQKHILKRFKNMNCIYF